MSAEEIFTQLSAHMIKGLMVHDQLANYYGFLGLDGYCKQQEYHFRKESESYQKLGDFYLKHYFKLISKSKVEDPNLIPSSWYKYTSFDVDQETKRKAVENGFKEWKKWETDTKLILENFRRDFFQNNDQSACYFLDEMIKDVSNEILEINKEILKLKFVDYDSVYINESQELLCKKYG